MAHNHILIKNSCTILTLIKSLIASGQNSVWSVIPGRLMQIDVSSADVVWGVNSAHHIYLGKDRWQLISGLLIHVSFGDAGVWGVNKQNLIYYRKGVSSENLEGTKWHNTNGKDN